MGLTWQRLDIDSPARGSQARHVTAAPRFMSISANPAAFSLELRSLLSCRAIDAEWADLAARALEPNVFAGPEMMLAAAHHLPARHAPAALLVREGAGPSGRLLALLPLETARMPVLPGAVHGYDTPYHPVGVPLVDKTSAVPVLRAVFDGLAGLDGSSSGVSSPGVSSPGVSGMLWKHVPLEGAFACAVMQAARQGNRQVDILGRIERPVIRASASEPVPARQPSRLRHDIERRRRRLAETGDIRFEEASSGQALRNAIESFMILEASSWKGIRGTALVQSARTSCFIRNASRMLARNGQCSVLTLFCGVAPVAAAITLETGGRSWAYKIAHDGAFARMSPGMILATEFCRRQQAKAVGHVTDSCMDEPNPSVARLWSEHAPYGDLLVSTTPGKTPGAVAMRLRERWRRNLRGAAKVMYRKAMGYAR